MNYVENVDLWIAARKREELTDSILSNYRVCSKHFISVAVVVAFFICWAPFHIQRLYSIYQQPSLETRFWNLKIYEIVTYVSGILYYMSATINPILYNIMSIKFREAFKDTFFRCCGIGNHGKPQRSYSVLSRSNLRCPDSTTDSGIQDQTANTYNSSLKNNSSDSYSSNQNKRFQRMTFNKIFEEERRSTIVESIFVDGNDNKKSSSTSINHGYMSVHIVNKRLKLKNFLKLFHHQKKQFDIHKKPSFFRKSSTEPNLFELGRSTRNPNSEIQEDEVGEDSFISNSSLRIIDFSEFEDELATYLNELKERDHCY